MLNKIDSNTSNPSKHFFLFLVAAGIAFAAMISGCAHAPKAEEPELLLYPPPPAQPRIQYLVSVSTPKDLPTQRSSFAEFVLGPEELRYPLVKPIESILIGSKVYVCDTVMNTVFVYDLVSGEARPLLGDRGMGKIKQANSIDVDDDGNIYVADKVRGTVLIYDASEKFVTALGRPGEVEPVDMAPRGGRLYVCDIKNHRVEIWDRQSGDVIKTIGELGKEEGQFFYPTFIAFDPDGNFYVTDTGNCRVQKYTAEGEFIHSFGGFGRSLGQFAWPKGMDVDGQGRVYVADSRFANIQIFDKDANLLLFFGGPGPANGNLDLPAGLRVFPWANIPMLSEKLAPGFDPEYLLIAVSQKGQGFLNFYAVARDADDAAIDGTDEGS